MKAARSHCYDAHELEKAAGLLRDVLASPGCYGMNFSNIKGYLGEILVRADLVCSASPGGPTLQAKGNQSSIDLELKSGGRVLMRIDVKTSTLKSEERGTPDYWGWALAQGKKKPVSGSMFVCVALDDSFASRAYYLVRERDLSEFALENGIGQFKNVTHGLRLLEDAGRLGEVPANTQDHFRRWHRMLEAGTVLHVPAEPGTLFRALCQHAGVKDLSSSSGD